VDNNYLDLGMNKSGFVHTLPSGRHTTTYNVIYYSSSRFELERHIINNKWREYLLVKCCL
jgi:hypothetical protein